MLDVKEVEADGFIFSTQIRNSPKSTTLGNSALYTAPFLYLLVRLFAVTQDQLERELMECPFCLDKVPKKAVKCRACASVLKQPVGYEAVVKTVGVKSLSVGKGQ
jgi:hypothetical protein